MRRVVGDHSSTRSRREIRDEHSGDSFGYISMDCRRGRCSTRTIYVRLASLRVRRKGKKNPKLGPVVRFLQIRSIKWRKNTRVR